jgi:DeoR family transcriptional regulator, copper-sensing transcriptional repressor
VINITGNNMSDSPLARRQAILERLHLHPEVSIQDLIEHLGVSAMTVHRDLNKLAAAGLLVKVHGGVRSAAAALSDATPDRTCSICSAPLSARTAFVIQRQEGGQIHACCPHCGLLSLERTPAAAYALAADFVHGRMVNVPDASYLVASRLPACCSPGILVLADAADAHALQSGFGGTVMSFEQVRSYVRDQMGLPA